jgi:predicted AlkP superfamily phosphohydrolase/phosphomutase
VRTRPGLFFVADGMRQDLVEKFAAEGAMPAMARLLREGVRGWNGVLPPMPTNTGAGWATLQTGAWSGKTGAINNYFHMPGTPVNVPYRGFGAELIEVETIVQAAERQGLRTLTFEWASSIPGKGQGPVLSYRAFFSARGTVANFIPPHLSAGVTLGPDLFATTVAFHPAAEWAHLPAGALPPMACSFVLPSRDTAVNPDRTLHLLALASGSQGYDRLLLCEGTDAAQPLASLQGGQWSHARMTLPDGRAVSTWLKCMDLAPDLSRLRLYVTGLSRPLATPRALEDKAAEWDLPPPLTADYGPLQSGIVDEQTYVEQGLLWFDYAVPALTRLVDEVKPDLLLAGALLTDEFSHQFLARTTPAYPGYDPSTATHYEALVRLAYQKTDEFFAHARALMPVDTVTVISSDHGFGAVWKSVNPNLVLQRAGLVDLDATNRPAVTSRAVAYGVGGTANVYVNLRGRERRGLVAPEDAPAIESRIVEAFAALQDPDAPDTPVIARVLRREETAAVETGEGPANMLHPSRTGDVVVFAAPPYQFDGAHPTRLIADAPLLGQHGYLADVVDFERSLNMRSAFVMHGPGVRQDVCLDDGRAIDLAPTLAYAMGIDGPKDADGRVLVEAFETAEVPPPATED